MVLTICHSLVSKYLDVLIEHKVDINIVDEKKHSLLFKAIQEYDFESVKLLIKNNANLHYSFINDEEIQHENTWHSCVRDSHKCDIFCWFQSMNPTTATRFWTRPYLTKYNIMAEYISRKYVEDILIEFTPIPSDIITCIISGFCEFDISPKGVIVR